MRRSQQLPFREQREPVIAYLSGTAPVGATWLYRRRYGVEELVATW
jgi:hypothetical protein